MIWIPPGQSHQNQPYWKVPWKVVPRNGQFGLLEVHARLAGWPASTLISPMWTKCQPAYRSILHHHFTFLSTQSDADLPTTSPSKVYFSDTCIYIMFLNALCLLLCLVVSLSPLSLAPSIFFLVVVISHVILTPIHGGGFGGELCSHIMPY